MTRLTAPKSRSKSKKPRAKTATKAQRTPRKLWQSSIGVIEGSGRFGEKRHPFNYNTAIAAFHSWCYIAASMNANAVASVPLRLYVRKRTNATKLYETRSVPVARQKWLRGEYFAHRPGPITMKSLGYIGDDMEEVLDHPILNLLHTMNGYENGYGATWLRMVYGELTGNAYLHPIIGPGGVPVELWTLPAQWVWVIPDRESFISGYVYGNTAQAAEQEYTPDEIIHFKRPNPASLFYGKGGVEAAWLALTQAESRMVMDRNFYDNMARPDYLIAVKGGAGREELDRFEADVNSKLRGVRNAGKMLAVSGEVTAEPMNFTPKEMSDPAYVVEVIAGCFGVPISKIKSNYNVAGGQAGVSDSSYPKDTVLPRCVQDADVLNARLLPMFDLDPLEAVLCYDDPVPKNQQFDIDRATKLSQSGLITIDEWREEDGMRPLPDGQGAIARFNGTPLDMVGQQLSIGGFGDGNAGGGRGSAGRGDGGSDEPSGDEVQDDEGGGAKSVAARSPAARTGGHERTGSVDANRTVKGGCGGHDLRISRQSDVMLKAVGNPDAERQTQEQFRRELESIFREQANAVILAGAGLTTYEVDRIVSDPKWIARIDAASRPFLGDFINMGGTSGMAQIPSAVGFDVTNPEVQKFVDRYAARLATGINQYTKVQLRTLLGDGLNQGETIAQLNTRVREWVDGDSATGRIGGAPYRADMISRTESARAFSAGEQAAWKQSGVVEGKQWLLAPGACEFCEAVAAQFNGKTVELERAFYKQGTILEGTSGGRMVLDYSDIDAPPLHPNCTCVLLPVLKDA